MTLETIPDTEKEEIFQFTFPLEQKAKDMGKKEGITEGKKEGRKEGALNLVLRRGGRRCGGLSETTIARINNLNLEQLEALDLKLDEIQAEKEITTWLDRRL